MMISERIDALPPDEEAWARRLFDAYVALLMAQGEGMGPDEAGSLESSAPQDLELELAQVALDTAEWLKTLWEVGYMGAGNFPAPPRSAFPLINHEDVVKSALFARIRQGKRPLPFPPPTRHGLPWHELFECDDTAQEVEAEVVSDHDGQAVGAVIEGCSFWHIIETREADQTYIVQHRGKGPLFRLECGIFSATLRREPPEWTTTIRLQQRAGIRSYTLEWGQGSTKPQAIPIRASTWERAESEADYWIATHHPEMYGRVRFVRDDVSES